MSILAIDTSSEYFQIALASNKGSWHYKSKKHTDHARSLVLAINDLLAENSLALSDLEIIRIIVGPGSYTGLRIGLAAVKTIAFLNKKIEVQPVSKFEFAALGFNPIKNYKSFTVILSCGKRRNEYFMQKLSADFQEQGKMMIIAKNDLNTALDTENSLIISDCPDVNIKTTISDANNNIIELVNRSLKFQKRNVEIIYLREIYAKIFRKNFALT